MIDTMTVVVAREKQRSADEPALGEGGAAVRGSRRRLLVVVVGHVVIGGGGRIDDAQQTSARWGEAKRASQTTYGK